MKCFAFVIGVNEYEHRYELSNAVPDAEAVADALIKLRFETIFIKNVTYAEFCTAFSDFLDKINKAEQMMRHIKTNLKNSENIGSKDCAQTFSFMYSLTESCSMNGLSPMRYIKMLLEKLKDEKVDKRTLLPCNYKEAA